MEGILSRFPGFRLSPPLPVGNGYAALPIGARLDFKYPFDSHFIKPGKDVPGHSKNTGGHLQSPHTYAGSARGRLRLSLADYLLHLGFAFAN